MLANAGSSLTAAVDTPNRTAAEMADSNNPVAGGDAMRHIVQSGSDTMQFTADSTPLSRSSRNDALPIKSGTLMRPIAGSQTEMSRAALSRAEEATNVIDTIKTWESAVSAIKWVMDTATPIASVSWPVSSSTIRPGLTSAPQLNSFASLAWSLLSKIPEVRFLILSQYMRQSHFCLPWRQTLLKQIQRDDNIQTLLEAIRDAFEFAEEAEILRSIKPESMQATILEKMLECVAECATFIRLYAEDVKVGSSSWPLSLVIISL